MASRLDDLVITGDRQLASQAYEAAIDTYRTALSEPGAVEAGVEDRLKAACRARDTARGVVPPAEPPAPPDVEEVGAPVETPAAPQVEPEPELEPAPPAVDDRPIEAPAFHLLEDDPSMLERTERPEYVESKPLSILDPTPPPPEPDPMFFARIVVAGLIGFAVCAAVFLASHRRSERISPPSVVVSEGQVYRVGDGVTRPVLESQIQPEYTEEARRAKIQGSVGLEVVVEPDGTVSVVRVVRSLDPELDRRAMEAVGKWRFQPGMRDGRPVRVRANVEVNFRLL